MKQKLILLTLTLTLALVLCGTVSAGDLNVTKGSWDTSGLDSNNVNVGPNQTLVQVRVQNNDTTTATDVSGTFSFTSANPYINLAPGESATKSVGDLQPGESKDLFFMVEITRNAAAYLTTRNYNVAVQGTNTPAYSVTGTLLVERLLSQQRNDITGISVSPNNPQVGQNFTVTVTSTTGSVTYPDLALPLVSYDPSVVMPLGVVTSYIDRFGNPQTTRNTYLAPPNANAFTSVWTFQVLTAGITDLYPVIYDRSGASYHYNADYGTAETVYVPASVGDWVWYDLNANGMQDPGELGVPNVLVSLYNSTGAQLETRVTDANGYYYFTNIYPGDYYLRFTAPAGYNFSPFYGPSYDNKANPSGQTAIFNLSPGENDYTWDAGIYQNATVGDFVWNDQNANGIYEGIGVGIPGVMVQIFDSADNLMGTTSTDGNGFYQFTNLLPGDYYLIFQLPSGFNFSPYIPGVTDNKANPSGRTATFNLHSGDTQLQWDAGMYQNTTIGDLVWNDLNANGMIDTGEPGIPGITVNLYPQGGLAPIASTTTNAAGNYLFSNLLPGSYFVEFVKPASYLFSPYNPGVTDNTANPLNSGRTATITLTSGESELIWDAGMYQNATVGDFVWMDLNLNGYFDPGESPLANIVVNLFTSAGAQIDSTSTDSNGNYLFTGLNPGSYYLQFVAPGGYVFSPVIGPPEQNRAQSNGLTAIFSLGSGQTDLSWDAGMLGPALFYGTLGDLVWDDQNADGINQGRGMGIPGVTVNLYLADGTPVATTITNANGFYYFTDLIPSIVVGQDYVVEFILPAGYNFSPYIMGVTDNQANPANGRTVPINLGIGQTQLIWDAGMYRNTTIGDLVWEDLNANGMQDPGEPGIPGVQVDLYLQGGVAPIATTTTDTAGNYFFSNLAPEDYIVEFTLPLTYNFSPYMAGVTDNTANPTNGRTATITLFSGNTQLQWDAGMYRNATLGDYVWNDFNANGLIDPGESGLADVIVNLYSQGIQVGSTTTDANGYYSFNVTPGDYFLEFVKLAGYNFSPYTPGVTDNTANPATGQTVLTTLTSGESELTWDAGMWLPASLGSFVWNDQNANGVFEGRGTGLPNVRVDLYDGLGVLLATTFTDANGFYSFTNLVPGNYQVGFTLLPGYFFSPQFPVTDAETSNKANPATGLTPILYLAAGENNPYIDSAMWQPVTIGDRVWNDLNRNGIQDPGEPGLANIPVELYNLTSTLISTTITDASGNYLFGNLVPNFYYAKYILPTGFQFSPQYAGTDPTIDSDAFPINGETAPREYTSGTVYLDLDAGMWAETADLALTKTVNPNPVTIGQPVTYTLVVRNNGPDTARNVTVEDAMPAGVEYVSHTATVGTYDPTTGIWTIGDLPNGAVATLTIVAEATRTGVFNNVAVVSSDTYDPNINNNRATASLRVNEEVKAISMQKTGAPLMGIILAILLLLSGLITAKRK